MKRGPPPLPSAVKRLRGTYRADRAPGEAASVPGVPKAPDFLGEDAQREWRRIVPLLYQRGLLERIDRAALVSYCTSWGDLAEATRILAEEGTTVLTPKGGLVMHPEMRRSDKARAHLRAFAQEFGLSPSARTRVKSSPPPTRDDSEADRQARRFFGSDTAMPTREELRRRFGGMDSAPPTREELRREFAP